ncbi:hypothetical protein [Aquipseudomonas alcaligenes]|uniref:Uncharacterized protein n=1 Tax=Aquipseudomonas alcaligenes (strain ATCC 14909 / DSM 50342 / CCUG 1425 / JCM 20561 / NBRC 14159 / NCIMB 9945 / NCTC 10367 / 1577) TaxID=1215092 RepID=U2Z9S1_AQUA1|nr:hypothetical protein [Pseudomonas alcaligenes]GAD64471.1 hypothetical protein PA6_038_00430 [Pseudomonas alcaligenes NBRC 14159]SUD20534.1 Uncharacterised protein [Pseudomonas alcaligenes]
MKIYVVSNGGQATADQLVKQLSRITLQHGKASPVIVVDDRYNLDQVLMDDAPVANTSYHLDDFLHDKGSIADGVMMVDANQIATKLRALTAEWVLFEFGQNDQATCLDFVRKLARYNYMTPTLRTKSVVFSVPSMYLAFFARTLNESFNSLPSSPIAVAQSGQVGMLLLSTKIERVFVSLPLLSAPLIRLNRLMMFIYRRFMSA